MYLGIDFLISKNNSPYILEVNIGLPGGVFEYDLAHRTIHHKPSDVYDLIEKIARSRYQKSFRDYIHSLDYKEELTAFKSWIDNAGPFPEKYSPMLRLEDKWVQYQLLLNNGFNLPYTEPYNPHDNNQTDRLLERFGRIVIKPRFGRHGKGVRTIDDESLFPLDESSKMPFILQEYIESNVEDYHFSVRAVSFDDEFICLNGYIVRGDISYKGSVIFIESGEKTALQDREFKIVYCPDKAWEGDIWFEGNIPDRLKENLIGERIAETILYLPEHTINKIKDIAQRIGKLYMKLNLDKLPKAWFEERDNL